MNRKVQFYSITLLLMSSSALTYKSLYELGQQKQETLQNVYNEPLKACGSSEMSPGSWDHEMKCSEKEGGVHQICIKRIGETTNKFSMNTGQSDWSTQRGKNNHCVCLGAWSMYIAMRNRGEITDQNREQLKCRAIPKVALSKRYVANFSKNPYYQGWQRWNGVQLEDQIVDGVNQLFIQCRESGSQSQKKALIQNYCDFAGAVEKLANSDSFEKFCK